MKRIPRIILLSLAVTFLVIGIHQSITLGFNKAYWLFMISLVFSLILGLKRNIIENTKNKNMP